jgi:very-short-patch-repair endonuclease
VDFYCRKLKLIIEIDGGSHDYKMDYDLERQNSLEKEGFKIIRFQEREVRGDVDNVIQRIVDVIGTDTQSLTPPVCPPRGGI